LLGSASLVDCDLHSRRDLKRWLSSVNVAPPRRGRGAGAQLVQHVMQAATRQFSRLYLYTLDHENWYGGMGWEVMERTTHNDHAVVIMSYDAPTGAMRETT